MLVANVESAVGTTPATFLSVDGMPKCLAVQVSCKKIYIILAFKKPESNNQVLMSLDLSLEHALQPVMATMVVKYGTIPLFRLGTNTTNPKM